MTVESTEITDLSMVGCPTPINMELPENVREFLPHLALADEVYDWCTSASLYVRSETCWSVSRSLRKSKPPGGNVAALQRRGPRPC